MQEPLNLCQAKPGEEKGFHGGKMKGEVGMSSEVMGLCFSSFGGDTNTFTHTLCSGPLGPKEMSVCGLIQPPVPVLMMASTCCFNVTAGSPSIPHWLWLSSAAGSSPMHTPPSAFSDSFISPHFHLQLLLPLISTIPLPYPSPCYPSFLPTFCPSMSSICSSSFPHRFCHL